MAKNIFQRAQISGLSAVVPKNEIRLADELQFFGGNPKKAQRVTAMSGMESRRVAEEGVLPSDLCARAAEILFNEMPLDRNTVDALIYASPHPDYPAPATACCLQERLSLPKSCAAFDISQGCSGYVYALWLAYSLVESGAARRVLLLSGFGLTRLFDVDNRIIAPLFGDGGAATLIERSEIETPSWFSLGTDGSGAEDLMIPAGGGRLPHPKNAEEYAPYCERLADPQGAPWRLNSTWMDGAAIFDFVQEVIPTLSKDLLNYAGKTPQDVDHLVLHQANKQIMSNIAHLSGFELEKTPMQSFSKYGNQSIASIPIALCDALRKELQEGRQTLLLIGFGIGLSWGAAIISTESIFCSGVHDFEKPANHPTPESILAHWRQKITGEPQ